MDFSLAAPIEIWREEGKWGGYVERGCQERKSSGGIRRL